MKKLVLSTIVMFATLTAQAATVNSSNEAVTPSSIDQVLRLVDKKEVGSSHKKLSIVVTDSGLSTDVSPRYTIYLGYASLAEMGNIGVNFKITDQAFQFVSASRKSAGIYEVKTIEYRDSTGLLEVTYTIDATKMFSDEQKERNKCGGDFCDVSLKTSVSVTESIAR